VIDPDLQGTPDTGFQVFLTLIGDAVGLLIDPTVLITHSPAGEDGHIETGSAKATCYHR
jgi:hypothetical protein